MKTDIAVIGAGPAGLFTAITAARFGAKTTIIEKNSSAGRKLLKTGRTRCNITHTGTVRDFIKVYGQFGRFLQHALYEFSPENLRKYLAQNNLKTKVENNGCVFPVTDRATDILRVLLYDAKKENVRFLYGRNVTSIQKQDDNLFIHVRDRNILARSVIIATGGLSWPHTGSTGDGYKFAKALGHNIITPKPALTTLITKQSWPAKLTGIGVPNVTISVKIDNKNFRTKGPLMFTTDGIGGPAVFDLSRLITEYLPNKNRPVNLKINLIPNLSSQDLEHQIIKLCSNSPQKLLQNILADFLPRALASQIIKLVELPPALHAGNLSKPQRKKLICALKALPPSITAAGPIEKATITRGGIDTAQIDNRTMQSKICPRLFFAGEIINVDGPCGGYNLQIAFSTAYLAGKTAASHNRT
jgi:predicted Rossmann fold flavoprotein